jgi:hypothetical protein
VIFLKISLASALLFNAIFLNSSLFIISCLGFTNLKFVILKFCIALATNPIFIANCGWDKIIYVLFENIRKQYPGLQPFLTNNESKQNMIEDLIMGMNESKLKLPTEELNKDLYRELTTFTYEYSPKTRRVKYGSASGFHDDCIISLALSYHSFKRKATYGTYVIR